MVLKNKQNDETMRKWNYFLPSSLIHESRLEPDIVAFENLKSKELEILDGDPLFFFNKHELNQFQKIKYKPLVERLKLEHLNKHKYDDSLYMLNHVKNLNRLNLDFSAEPKIEDKLFALRILLNKQLTNLVKSKIKKRNFLKRKHNQYGMSFIPRVNKYFKFILKSSTKNALSNCKNPNLTSNLNLNKKQLSKKFSGLNFDSNNGKNLFLSTNLNLKTKLSKSKLTENLDSDLKKSFSSIIFRDLYPIKNNNKLKDDLNNDLDKNKNIDKKVEILSLKECCSKKHNQPLIIMSDIDKKIREKYRKKSKNNIIKDLVNEKDKKDKKIKINTIKIEDGISNSGIKSYFSKYKIQRKSLLSSVNKNKLKIKDSDYLENNALKEIQIIRKNYTEVKIK